VDGSCARDMTLSLYQVRRLDGKLDVEDQAQSGDCGCEASLGSMSAPNERDPEMWILILVKGLYAAYIALHSTITRGSAASLSLWLSFSCISRR
jgi:hypothetical protein